MNKILVAGSTGYLGSHIVQELMTRKMDFKAIARNRDKLMTLGLSYAQIIEAEVTDKTSLIGSCDGMDTVISTIGITRQRDGLTYMDVDYQANKNLLDDAIKNGVTKFIYISVLHGQDLTHLKICAAKERFVRELQESGIDYCVIRPSGFYSDIKEIYEIAKSGRVYLFGDGSVQLNPIHGADLAKVCVDAVFDQRRVIEVGGREILSHRQIAETAFRILDKKTKITYIPDWVRRLLLRVASIFMRSARYGPTEFFLTVMDMDMTTRQYGHHTLQEYFAQLREKDS